MRQARHQLTPSSRYFYYTEIFDRKNSNVRNKSLRKCPVRTPSVHYADTGWQTATTLTFESLSNDKVTLIVLLSLIFPFASGTALPMQTKGENKRKIATQKIFTSIHLETNMTFSHDCARMMAIPIWCN